MTMTIKHRQKGFASGHNGNRHSNSIGASGFVFSLPKDEVGALLVIAANKRLRRMERQEEREAAKAAKARAAITLPHVSIQHVDVPND